MSFELVDFKLLKERIKLNIRDLILIYKHDEPVDLEKLEDSLRHLPRNGDSPRKCQTTVLLKIIQLLSELPPSEDDSKNDEINRNKALVLNGAVYYFIKQIESAYKVPVLNWFTSPETGSTFYPSLRTSLGLIGPNPIEPNHQEVSNMYRALEKFLCQQVLVDGDPEEGFLADHPFKNINKLFEVERMLEELQDTCYLYNRELYDNAEKLSKQAIKPKKAGILSFFKKHKETTVLPPVPPLQQTPTPVTSGTEETSTSALKLGGTK